MNLRTMLYVCENEGFCTSDCELRDTCRKQRISFLIHAVVIDYKNDEIYPDEYINELAILKQKLIDEARHQSGHSISPFKRSLIEITAL